MTFDTLFGVLILGAIALASMALLYGIVWQIRDRECVEYTRSMP